MQSDKKRVIYLTLSRKVQTTLFPTILFILKLINPIADVVSGYQLVPCILILFKLEAITQTMTPAPLTEPIAAKDAPASNATQALKVALEVLDKKTLLDVLLDVVDNNPIVQRVLEKQMLVLGSEVVRYHIDSDSEDNKEESEEETVQKEHKISREKRPIAIKDDEFTGRFAVCLNCERQFNVTKNFKGNCIWHPGVLSYLNYL